MVILCYNVLSVYTKEIEMIIDHSSLYASLGGTDNEEFPSMLSHVKVTPTKGVAYLTEPSIIMISKPNTSLDGTNTFLSAFGHESYLDDMKLGSDLELCKFAGQLCYMSFGKLRTYNKDVQKYFDNIKSSGHGSVIEHASYSFLFYGISRSATHEIVRHRAGFAYSQVSQRYVKVLRFVERPEYISNSVLHEMFIERIEKTAELYGQIISELTKAHSSNESMPKTEIRKMIQQSARSVLSNETEAPIVVTGNARAWRHFIEMRGSKHAEPEINKIAVKALLCLSQVNPVIFGDYEIEATDTVYNVTTKYKKV
jgi:thymidylate synthase (FAD)